MPNVKPKAKAELPVDRRAMIKTLYETIGRHVFGMPEPQIEWMKGFIDQHMTDREVDLEWGFIQKGNVKKFIALFEKLKQDPEKNADQIEKLSRMHEDISNGIMKYKSQGLEIEPETFKAVEKTLEDFVDEMMTELEGKKALPENKQKLIGALDARHIALAMVLASDYTPV